MKTTFDTVRDILVDLAIPREDVTPIATLEQLGADSLDQIELVMAVEEAFELEISDEEAEQLSTVQQLVDYIDQTLAKVPAPESVDV